MSKLLANEVNNRPPVRLRLPQISLQELKTIRVAIRRKDVSQDGVAGPLIRTLEHPEDLVLHKPEEVSCFHSEGEKPIFDRDDIIVNLDFEERVVLTTTKSPRRSTSRPVERQRNHSRSRSHSRNRNFDRKYYRRSKSLDRPKDRLELRSNDLKEDVRIKQKTNIYRSEPVDTRGIKTDIYDKPHTSSSLDRRRRSNSKERRRSISPRDRERSHSNYHKSPIRQDSYRAGHYGSDKRSRRTPSPYKYEYNYRKYSRSPTHKREGSRSRSPYRDRNKYREYRKRSRSPYVRDRYKSPTKKEHREYSRSPPLSRSRGTKDVERRHNQSSHVPFQIPPPQFGAPWPIYETMPPYVRFFVPDGFIPAARRFPPGNVATRPRLPQRPLPIYNSRPIPKPNDPTTTKLISISNTSATSTSDNKEIVSDSNEKNIPHLESVTNTANTSKESFGSSTFVATTERSE